MYRKYNNKKVHTDEGEFLGEHDFVRWHDLKLLQREGKISELRRKVRFQLCETPYDEDGKAIFRGVYYVADFVYVEDGKTVVEDCKGFSRDIDPTYQFTKKWFYDKYRILIRET